MSASRASLVALSTSQPPGGKVNHADDVDEAASASLKAERGTDPKK